MLESHYLIRRTSSAPLPPVPCVKEPVQESTHHLSRVAKDEELCPWSMDSSKHEINKYTNKQSSRKNTKPSSTSSTLTYKKSSLINNARFKSGKWYLRSKDSKTNSPEYTFQHYVDTSRYIDEYRARKLKKLQQEFPENLTTVTHSLSHESVYIASTVSKYSDKGHPISLIPYNNRNESTTIGYRLEGRHKKSSLTKESTTEKPREQSPMKIRGGKCFDCDEDGSCVEVRSRTSSVSTLPKCDGVFLPNRSLHYPNLLQPEHVLQCKRLNELSLNSSQEPRNPSYSMQRFQGWKPQPVKTRETFKLRSAQEKKRLSKVSNGVKYNDYSQIIKRVIEHYDPSQNPVSAAVTKEREAKITYLLATT